MCEVVRRVNSFSDTCKIEETFNHQDEENDAELAGFKIAQSVRI